MAGVGSGMRGKVLKDAVGVFITVNCRSKYKSMLRCDFFFLFV